ncbi:HAD-like protein [Dendrothele bispora CBS 962.96]|uniref:Mitochondrial import inner membrane translocase subunit TIM50 n=1 Tax=Dendrothele bispora (strain CBS 962.96) TaxID=1314807 RepID=A0A4S8M7B4_DENBC|nr:HAD-like protein [Dendrothele bispora CBS 962.96]
MSTPPPPPPHPSPSKTQNEQSRSKDAAESTKDSSETLGASEQPTMTRPNLSSVPSLDFSPPDPREEAQTTGARSSRDTLTSAEQQRQRMGRVMLGVLTLALGMGLWHMGREWDEEELKRKKLTREAAIDGRWDRMKTRVTELFDVFVEPAWPELLPPPYPPPHQKPYTLLISVDDLLVTSVWDRQHGWRTAKRPGVDYFLAYISQFFEVVVFTTQHSYTAMPILESLDRYNFFITHKLFREATRSVNGQVVKDLSYLNRDLSKVILLDTNSSHVATHPENAVILPKWKGDPRDRGLVAIIPFLESIAIYKPQDVRPILTAYQGKDIPTEYAKIEAEGKRKHVEEWQQNKGSTSNSFGSLFGLSSSRSAQNAPPTYLEQKRKEAQQQYLEEQAYINKNREYLEELLKQDQDMMAQMVPNNFWEALDQLRGNPPKALLEAKEKAEKEAAQAGQGQGQGSGKV